MVSPSFKSDQNRRERTQMENHSNPSWSTTPARHRHDPSSFGDVFTSSGNELASNNRARKLPCLRVYPDSLEEGTSVRRGSPVMGYGWCVHEPYPLSSAKPV